MQRQTLLERALYLVTIRALLEDAHEPTAENQEQLRKVIACRRLLAPIGEGLALYTQFDYFPSNFFIGAGKRSPYDGFLEFLVARRGFEDRGDNADDLPTSAWKALAAARFTDDALRKKRGLLESPLLILDDHITGYLIIKSIIADARCGEYRFFVHDGLLVPLILSLFYNCPGIIKTILDPDICCDEAIESISESLQRRLTLVRDGETLTALLLKTRGREPDFEHSVALEEDKTAFAEAQTLYSLAYDELMEAAIASLDHNLRDEQCLNEPHEEKQGLDSEALWPPALLSSPHFGRVFTANVRIRPTGETLTVELKSTGQTISFNSNSLRAEAYRWIKPPKTETDGTLTEAIVHLSGLQHDFFHISFISYEGGMLALEHNTQDYNVGYSDLAAYLEDAYRVDRRLEGIECDLALFDKRKLGKGEAIRRAKEFAYLTTVESIVEAIAGARLSGNTSRNWFNGSDLFNSEEDFVAYIAFSLAVRFADFAFESYGTVRHYVRQQLDQFGSTAFRTDRALRYISKRGTLCRIQNKCSGFTPWYSFTCLL
jgi:hypothetical protein